MHCKISVPFVPRWWPKSRIRGCRLLPQRRRPRKPAHFQTWTLHDAPEQYGAPERARSMFYDPGRKLPYARSKGWRLALVFVRYPVHGRCAGAVGDRKIGPPRRHRLRRRSCHAIARKGAKLLHSGCIGLSDQTRRATQRRLKPPEWQQAQSQQEASRSTPKSYRPLNSAQFLNLAVAALVLTPRSRQRLQCRFPCRLVAVVWRATFMTFGRPHPLPRFRQKDAADYFSTAKHVIVFDAPGRDALEGKVVFVHVSPGCFWAALVTATVPRLSPRASSRKQRPQLRQTGH